MVPISVPQASAGLVNSSAGEFIVSSHSHSVFNYALFDLHVAYLRALSALAALSVPFVWLNIYGGSCFPSLPYSG